MERVEDLKQAIFWVGTVVAVVAWVLTLRHCSPKHRALREGGIGRASLLERGDVPTLVVEFIFSRPLFCGVLGAALGGLHEIPLAWLRYCLSRPELLDAYPALPFQAGVEWPTLVLSSALAAYAHGEVYRWALPQ